MIKANDVLVERFFGFFRGGRGRGGRLVCQWSWKKNET